MKAVKKIRAYTTFGVDCQKELLAKLEMAKVVEATARNATVEGIGLLRKVEMKNDMLQPKICQPKLDNHPRPKMRKKVLD